MTKIQKMDAWLKIRHDRAIARMPALGEKITIRQGVVVFVICVSIAVILEAIDFSITR